jgi:hypothetical protein
VDFWWQNLSNGAASLSLSLHIDLLCGLFVVEVVLTVPLHFHPPLQIDHLCAGVDGIKLALASPQARTNACVGSATAAVLSALHSAAAVAAATARGDDAAASRAAAAAANSAAAAVQQAQQLQLDASDVLALFCGQASTEAEEASGDLLGSSSPQPAAAAGIVGAALPIATLADDHSTTPPTSAAAALTSAAPSSAGTSLQLAVAGAELATELAQVPTSPLLRRGAGLLVLFPNSWRGKTQALQAGKALVAGKAFTHYSILQLMSKQGLLLRAGSEQSVSVRVAAQYLQPATALTGNWSTSCFPVSSTPGVNLLLHHTPGGASSLPSAMRLPDMPGFSLTSLKPTSQQL